MHPLHHISRKAMLLRKLGSGWLAAAVAAGQQGLQRSVPRTIPRPTHTLPQPLQPAFQGQARCRARLSHLPKTQWLAVSELALQARWR